MDVIDVTDPDYKRDAKKLKKLQKLLAIQRTHEELAGAKKQFHFKAVHPQPSPKLMDRDKNNNDIPMGSV